jgi:hypothetical protein
MFRRAKEEGHFVSIERAELERGAIRGYVEAFTDELLLVTQVNPEIRYDGFSIVRIEDITQFESPSCCQEFAEMALQLRKLQRPSVPDIDLTSIGSALISIKREFPLVAIQLELDEPEALYAGRIESVDHEKMSLLYIDDHAVFDEAPLDLHLTDITRITFGTGFEEALHLVSSARQNNSETTFE